MHDGRAPPSSSSAGRRPRPEPTPALWRHPNGRWYVLYGPGLKSRVSSGSTSRAEAEEFLKDWQLGHAAGAVTGTTVADILKGYAAEKTPEVRSPGTIKYSVGPLIQHLGNLTPEQLLRQVIREYPKLRRKAPAKGRGIRNGTILREIGTLRAALAWGVECGLIASYPHISNPVTTAPPKDRWLTREEAKALLAQCREPQTRTFVMLALMTAARSGAILELRWERDSANPELAAILWGQNLIDYGPGHGNKRRAVVPMNKELRKFLESMRELACSDHVIERHGRPVESIRRGFEAACERAGIKGVTAHTLRHTAATWMAMAAVPMREIARTLGDTEAVVEKHYAKHHPDYLKAATGALRLNPKAAHARRPAPGDVLTLQRNFIASAAPYKSPYRAAKPADQRRKMRKR